MTDKTLHQESNLPTKESKRYQIIYADPAWKYYSGPLRNVENHYDVMSTDEIKNLDIAKLADDDCVLFIWVTYPCLPDVFDVIKAWGFEYKTVAFTWIKTNGNGTFFVGMGHWTRSNAEICLLATKGKPKRLDAGISQIIKTQYTEHSKKPDIVRQKIIQLVGDLPRIELFARTKIHGWDTWGNDERLTHQPLEAFQ